MEKTLTETKRQREKMSTETSKRKKQRQEIMSNGKNADKDKTSKKWEKRKNVD
jgi:hypothetical protein